MDPREEQWSDMRHLGREVNNIKKVDLNAHPHELLSILGHGSAA